MSEVKKIATRDSYGAALVELAKDHPDVVVLDADLAAATKTGVFKKAYPDRHFDCGIAESNMMATAAGMAAMGLVPFASSFAMFAAGRAFEQVRNSIGYPHRQDRCHPRRHLGGRGRRLSPVLRGFRPYALHPRHDGALPCRRRGGQGCRQGCL